MGVVGGKGAVVKEIEQHTGCKISLNQDPKDQGYSVATLTGDSQQISRGYESITEKVRQANPSATAPAIIGGATPRGAHPGGPVAPQFQQPVAIIGGGAAAAILASTIELKLDQKWVGWILGKQGQTMKALESETGCSITLNQDTKDAGYSTVKVHGSFNGLQTALQRIGASLDSAVAHPANADSLNGASTSGGPDTMEETVMVEQRYVGWLLGKS